MPRGNGHGPFGAGPETGRGADWCATSGTPGHASPPHGSREEFAGQWRRPGRGLARGRHGWRNGCHATGLPGWARAGGQLGPTALPDPAAEKEALQHRADALEAELEMIRKLLDETIRGATENE